MLSIDYNRTSKVFVDVHIDTTNHNLNIPLILDMYKIMILMQKLLFIQEFTSAVNVVCLHSILPVKLLLHNCARAKNAKTCFCSV